MTRWFHIICLGLLGLLLGGCIHLEQRIQINPNGAGVITYEYSVAEETFGTVAAGRMAIGGWQDPPVAGLNWFASERAVNEYFAGDEFEVQQYRTTRQGGRRHVRIVVLAKDIQAALATGKIGDFRLDQTPEGNWRFHGAEPAKPAKKLSDAEVDKLRALCDDLWLRLIVVTPNPIVTATTKDREETQATWLFDPGADDSFLRERPRIEVVYQSK